MFTVPVGDWFKEKRYSFCKDRIRNLKEKQTLLIQIMLINY